MARESNFKNMVITLLVVTLLSSASLGLVYNFTKDPIAAAQVAKVNAALGKVLPEFDNNPSRDMFTREVDGGILTFYSAKKGGEPVGTAVHTFTLSGYSGRFDLMVGFLPDGTINGIEVLEHKETPGLGDKMQTDKSDFHVQFQGQHPDEFQLAVTKDGGDVDAIVATTISSRAYCQAVQRAYDALMKEGGSNE